MCSSVNRFSVRLLWAVETRLCLPTEVWLSEGATSQRLADLLFQHSVEGMVSIPGVCILFSFFLHASNASASINEG